MRVLGIGVTPELGLQWVDWLMPRTQPYIVPEEMAIERGWGDVRSSLSAEVVDSFEIYGVRAGDVVVAVDRETSMTLPAQVRHAQPGRHRWRSGDDERDIDRVVRYVTEGRRVSRHAEVTARTWRAARELLPGALDVAGTFPSGSGPNCFAMVMASAGVEGAAAEWMQRDPFEDWLAKSTVPGGRDADAGTVIVWRTAAGLAAHAAVTVGEGWFLHKRSQGWMSPTKILTAADGKYSSRQRGLRLHRYQILA